MSEFESALNHVYSSLLQMQREGRTAIRASTASLKRLKAAIKAPQTKAAKRDDSAALEKPVSVPAAPAAREQSGRVQENAVAVDKEQRLAALRERVLVCEKCPHLVRSRTQPVFGVGNPDAELMFVGEAPGADEDLAGEPFVGKAGALLTKIIQAMSFQRSDVYIANVLKCRPDMPEGATGNRKPRGEEMKTCLPYLLEQIDIIRPKVLVALGATAMEGLTGNTTPVGVLRGKWQEFQGIPLMVTYHPAYLLRNQSNTEKRKVWEDMLLVMERLNCPISEKQRGFFLTK